MALVAPRGLLLASAYAEGQGAPFGFEHAYRGVKSVYDWMNAGRASASRCAKANTRPRPKTSSATSISSTRCSAAAPAKPPEDIILGYNYEDWRARQSASPPRRRAPPPPPGVSIGCSAKSPPASRSPTPPKSRRPCGPPPARWNCSTTGRSTSRTATHAPLSFGDDLKADLYLPARRLRPLPPSSGSTATPTPPAIRANGRPMIQQFCERRLRRAGVRPDRLRHAHSLNARFYERYPRWSVMGAWWPTRAPR
jgi:hypothetical protein